MTEPDVALTDYALALMCGAFCVLAARWNAADNRLRRYWIVLFASIGIGSLLGGTVHGFFTGKSAGNTVLWLGTMLALGVTGAAMWFIGACIQLRGTAVHWVQRAAIALLIAYALVVLFVTSRFYVAIAAYLPATVFLIVAMTLAYRRAPSRPLLSGIVGLALTFVAAAVQQLRIAIHPVYFNHNALYHVIQGIALALLFVGARHVTTRPDIGRSAA